MAASLNLTLTKVSQNEADNSSRVRVRLTITTSLNTFNESGDTSGSIKLDGKTIASLDGKKVYLNTTTTLYDKEHDVIHNADGRKTVTASASFDVNTSVRWISAAAELSLPRIPRASELKAPTIVLGTINTLELVRAVASYEDKVLYTLGEVEGVVSDRTAATLLQWTPPIDLAAQIPDSSIRAGTLTVVTYSGSEEIGRQNYTFTAQVPTSVKPAVIAELKDANGWLDKYGAYVQNRSKLDVSLTGTGAYGSTISAFRITVDGSAYLTQRAQIELPVPNEALPVKAQVLDSRGHWSDEYVTTIEVLRYLPPTVTELRAGRCDLKGLPQEDGAFMALTFSATVTPLKNLNAADYSARYREVGEDSWHTVLLPELSGVYEPRDAGAIIAADTEKAYEVMIYARDGITGVPSNVATVPIAFVFFQFDAKTRSWAFFQKAVEPNTFRIAAGMAARLPADTKINGKTLLDLIYPIGSLYLSTVDVSPEAFLGGAWQRIEDVFLLAAGSTYAPGTVGGEAEVKLAEEQLPKLSGTVNFRPWGSGSPYAGASGIISNNGEIADTANGFSGSTTEDGYRQLKIAFGGGQAHNNLPPFLAVYMWQRVADPVIPDEPDDSGFTVTDDDAGNVTIEAYGPATITDDGAGNMTLTETDSASVTDDGAGNVTIT